MVGAAFICPSRELAIANVVQLTVPGAGTIGVHVRDVGQVRGPGLPLLPRTHLVVALLVQG